MKFEKWMESAIKKLDWKDIPLIKLATAASVLMLAKLWQPLLSLEWYWYFAVFILAAIRPAQKMFLK